MFNAKVITVVIPCYKCDKEIFSVLKRIGSDVKHIIVVDDACPNMTGDLVHRSCDDTRVQVIWLNNNQGVGGATMAGFIKAIEIGSEIIVKIDGDGQMDPVLIPNFVKHIQSGDADYVKGNRFFNPDNLSDMPIIRLIGNAFLSFFGKFSTGYWHVFDPTNGYIAVDARIVKVLPLKNINKRFFFESDMLFRLNLIQAKILDVPMKAVYNNESSNLSPLNEMFNFSVLHIRNFVKRIIYTYFIRDFSIASINLVLGIVFVLFGFLFGTASWYDSITSGVTATAGTIMIAALPIFIGIQFVLNFLSFDMSKNYNKSISEFL
jgi:dolichol-phosphate mannosyltransferase